MVKASQKFFYWLFQDGSSVPVLHCLCACGFICGVCSFVIICSSYSLLLVPRDCCFSWASSFILLYITKTRLSKDIENFTTKNWQFSDKKADIFPISVQNINYGYLLEPPRRGGSNEYPQSMCLSRNKKNNVYPCKLQFYYIKVGFYGVKII